MQPPSVVNKEWAMFSMSGLSREGESTILDGLEQCLIRESAYRLSSLSNRRTPLPLDAIPAGEPQRPRSKK
jgi:hypothetical protein